MTDTPQRKRLLIISPWATMWSLGEGAGVSDERHFIEGFRRAGYDIHFLIPEPPDGARSGFDDLGVRVHTYPNFFADTAAMPVWLKRLLWMPLFQLLVMPRATRLARELQPVAVLGHSHYTSPVVWACRKHTGIPGAVKLFGVMDLVHTEWPAWKYWFKNLEQLVALKFPQDAWIILDDGTRGDEIARSRGVAPETIHFLPNGVNLEWQQTEWPRDDARAQFDLPRDAKVVTFLARLVPSKRPLDVIRAAPAVLEQASDALFVFAGDGPLRAECESLARELGVHERVRFLGAVPHQRVPQLFAASDVFATTSNLTNKALPTCEALICGVPVVAYDVGDTASAVRDGETGALVRDGDVAALARATARLLNDDAARAQMADNARTLAREQFTSWRERIDMELALFARLARI